MSESRTVTHRLLPWCVAATTLLGCWLSNPILFRTPLFEGGDAAADSLLIIRATHLDLLTGHYSRLGFYHPGPGLMYILAAGQWLFHDVTGLVPGPFNGQLLAATLLSAAAAGLSTAALQRALGTLPAALAGGAMVTFLISAGTLLDSWPPVMYIPLFLLFVVSGACLAAGRTGESPLFIASGGLLIHGHVSFISTVLATTVLVGISWWSTHRRSAIISELRQHRGALITTLMSLLVLTLPMFLNVLLHWPGEWEKYWIYASESSRQPRSLGDAWSFTWHYWQVGQVPTWLAVASVLVGLAALRAKHERRLFGALWAMFLLQTLLFVFYAYRGVDVLNDTNRYVGLYYQVIPAMAVATAGMQVAVYTQRTAWSVQWRKVVAGMLVTAAGSAFLIVLRSPDITRFYKGDSGYDAAASWLTASPQRQGRPVALHLSPTGNRLLAGAGVAIALQRRGVPWCVVDQRWAMPFTEAHICGQTESDWNVTLYGPPNGHPPQNVSAPFYSTAVALAPVG